MRNKLIIIIYIIVHLNFIIGEYNLTNVTPGSYVTTILWYEDWADGDNNGWYYNTTVPLKWTNRSLK